MRTKIFTTHSFFTVLHPFPKPSSSFSSAPLRKSLSAYITGCELKSKMRTSFHRCIADMDKSVRGMTLGARVMKEMRRDIRLRSGYTTASRDVAGDKMVGMMGQIQSQLETINQNNLSKEMMIVQLNMMMQHHNKMLEKMNQSNIVRERMIVELNLQIQQQGKILEALNRINLIRSKSFWKRSLGEHLDIVYDADLVKVGMMVAMLGTLWQLGEWLKKVHMGRAEAWIGAIDLRKKMNEFLELANQQVDQLLGQREVGDEKEGVKKS